MDKRDAIDVTLGIAAGVGVATGIAGVCVGATALKQTKRLQLQVSSHNSRIEELEAAAVCTANAVATAARSDVSFDCVGDIYDEWRDVGAPKKGKKKKKKNRDQAEQPDQGGLSGQDLATTLANIQSRLDALEHSAP
jgi:hypothetical protein